MQALSARLLGFGLWCFGASFAHAAPPASQATLAQPAAAGSAVLIVGPVFLVTPSGEVPLLRGHTLHEGDSIRTGEGGFAHIRMVDGALVAIRPNSAFQLEVVAFQANAKTDRMRFRLEHGVARSITGAIGETNKESFRLNTPVAAVGVRGTDFVVSTNDSTSRVSVNSGAVVVAALGNGCRADGFGACGPTGMLLGAASSSNGEYIEVLSGGQMPRLVQDAAGAPDNAAPIHPDEPIVQAFAERTAPIKPSEHTAPEPVPDLQPSVPSGPNTGLEPDVMPTPTVTYWGRWGAPQGVDQGSATRVSQLLEEGRKILIANGAYGAGVDAMPDKLPSSGSIGFHAAAGEGVLVGREGETPLALSDGSLAINFDDRSFTTHSNFTGGGNHYDTQAAGTIDSRGYMNSSASQSNSMVSGALGNDLNSAITTVERDFDDGRLMGVVAWGRE